MSDVYQQPILTRDGQTAPTLTLLKESPPPMRRLTGSLTGTTRHIMDLVAKGNIPR